MFCTNFKKIGWSFAESKIQDGGQDGGHVDKRQEILIKTSLLL